MGATIDPLDLLIKQCARCKRRKPWREFSVTARFEDGSPRRVDSYCKHCRVELTSAWEKRSRARRNPYRAAWKRNKMAALKHQSDRFKDAGPLRDFLLRDGQDPPQIAAVTGISPETINRIIGERNRYVRLSTADQIITRLGGCLEFVYPYEPGDAQ